MTIEINDKLITEIGINSIIDFYKTIAIDQLQINGLDAFVTGVDSASLNVVIDARKNGVFNFEIINLMANFFRNYQVPWGWFITAVADVDNIEKFDFKLLYKSPGMYFDLSDMVEDAEDSNIIMKEVHDDLKTWIEPLLEGFPTESDSDDDVYRKINADLLQKGERKLRHFIAYYQNEIAAAGTLFLSDQSVMIHNLATKHKFKKLGLGTALTKHMMYEAKKCGYKHCFLDSSDEGFNLYSRLGFKVYGFTSVYEMNRAR